MSRFLITTALEETWRDGEPVLFLGEWCRLYTSRARWSAMDAQVLPYHWDDRSKLYADYLYLRELHERLLVDLTEQLNKIHDVDHEVRYWRILAGPWLGYFTQILFDRWCSIRQANTEFDLSGTVILDGAADSTVPKHMADFTSLLTQDDWNHQIYASILQRLREVPISRQARSGGQSPDEGVSALGWNQRVKRELLVWFHRWGAAALGRDQDAFLMSTYLPMWDEIVIQLRLRQIPQVWRTVPAVRIEFDRGQRQWNLCGDGRSEFEVYARAMIPQQIPTAYLEGYAQLHEQTVALPWPKRPKVIWSSNSFIGDDVFKAWAAQKVEAGAPLVIGQHGGHYGIGLWSFHEEHETAISDCYLTWGWIDAGQPWIRPVGQLKGSVPLGVRHSEQRGALLVTVTTPRQSYRMYSTYVSSQWLDYFRDQCTFVERLPDSIRTALTVRLFPVDYGWSQADRWRHRFPDLHLDDGRSDLDELIRGSRLFISTYNATTYLESIAMNVPTVIFWNPDHWELRDSATPYFDDLERVGVFHRTPESAAAQVAAIWGDVDEWWESAPVREVVGAFAERYAIRPHDLLARIEGTLREVMTECRRGS